MKTPIYLDHHATTPCDPRVVDAMLPFLGERFGNAGSTTHVFGWEAKETVDSARATLAAAIGADPRELVFTSGATESNNLAIRGVAERHERSGGGAAGHVVGVATEHRAVLDPLARLARRGFDVTLLPVVEAPDAEAGRLRAEQVAEALRDDTILVTVMLANNEIGAIPPLAEIAAVCHDRGVLLHSDATQAVGRIPVQVDRLGVDLMSFSAHKLYGPKGVGALYVRRRERRVRLEPILDGGGQEGGLRSGTLNVPGIVGFARAVQICLDEMPDESRRLAELRDRLYEGLRRVVPDVRLNGPALDRRDGRLTSNLNVSFARVDGEALLLSAKELALSSGSACTSADPEPSHVLRALGLPDEAVRGSVRFGLGRSNTVEEIDFAVELLGETVARLRRMGGTEGI